MILVSRVKHLDNRSQMSRGIKMTLMLRRVLEKGNMAQTLYIQWYIQPIYRAYI